jgi:hypothetical protein
MLPALFNCQSLNKKLKRIKVHQEIYRFIPGIVIMKPATWFGHPYSASRRLTLALRICSPSVLIGPHGNAMRTENWRIGHWGDSWYNTSIPRCGYKKK